VAQPPRRSTTWWAGVVQELNDGWAFELWHFDHRHRGEAGVLECAAQWACAEAAVETTGLSARRISRRCRMGSSARSGRCRSSATSGQVAVTTLSSSGDEFIMRRDRL
jgi:hypothetical protein